MSQYLLYHLLEETANRCPDREAVVSKDGSITYAELNTKSTQISQALMELGVEKGDRIALLLNKSIEAIICIFGILKAGAIYVPIDPLAPVSRAKYIINNCKINLLITSKEAIEKNIHDLGKDISLKNILLIKGHTQQFEQENTNLHFLSWENVIHDCAESYRQPNIPDAAPAYILHTSGSTGVPKGVVISHLNALTFVNMAADFFEITENDRLCSHSPLHFDLSVFDIYVAVKNAAAIVLVPELLSIFPMKLAQFIADEKISVWNSVASALSLLADRGKLERFQFDNLRCVLFSGDVLPVKYLRQLMNRMPITNFFNIYGQTEANSSTFYHVKEIPDDNLWKIPIGKAFPNFEVFVLNDNNEKTSPGETGELYVSGSTVALGYWGMEEKTSEAFVLDPRSPWSRSRVYKTGDLVTVDDEGNHIYIGRRDQQVKSRGYRIQLNEIEVTMNSHTEIKEAVVVAIPDEIIGNRIISYVSPVNGTELTEIDILDYCSMFLPNYMLPEKINLMSELPKTPTGKTDRKLLKETASGPTS